MPSWNATDFIYYLNYTIAKKNFFIHFHVLRLPLFTSGKLALIACISKRICYFSLFISHVREKREHNPLSGKVEILLAQFLNLNNLKNSEIDLSCWNKYHMEFYVKKHCTAILIPWCIIILRMIYRKTPIPPQFFLEFKYTKFDGKWK